LNRVPITGWVDASTVIEPESEQVPSEGLGDIELPFPISPSRVVGDSMLPKYENGDVIASYREQRSPSQASVAEIERMRTKTSGRTRNPAR